MAAWLLRAHPVGILPAGIQTVDLRSQDKVAFRQPVYRVREDLDSHLPPGKKQVRMMTLFFGDIACTIDKIETLTEVREKEIPFDVVLLDDPPIR